jgi:EPS-associated MarR family transcriptional regulator
MSEKPVSSRQAAAQEDVHFRVIRLLEANPDMSQRALAAHVGISLGSLNYCLKALVDKGFVKLENFQKSKHKCRYVYILTPAGVAQKVALTDRFLKRKTQEYEALKAEIEGLEAELVDRETYGLSEVSKPHARAAK